MRTRTFGSRLVRRGLATAGVGALLALGWATSAVAQTSPAQQTTASDAAAPGSSAADVDSLRERVAAFWAARVAGDFAKQWELLEPRGRGRISVAEYAPQSVVKYLGYQVEDANVKGYFASVRVRLLVQAVIPTAQNRKIAPSAVGVKDVWVRIQGTWYRSMEQGEDAPWPLRTPR
jgi:hypothetical protein